MITKNIITAEQREQLKELANELYKRNVKLNNGDADNIYNKYLGAIELIASAYSFYEEGK